MNRQVIDLKRSPIIRINSAHSDTGSDETTRKNSLNGDARVKNDTASGTVVMSLDDAPNAAPKEESARNNEDNANNKTLNGQKTTITIQVQDEDTLQQQKAPPSSHATLTLKVSSSGSEATHAYAMRWFVLAIFCSHSAINSFQWIQYSSITNIVTAYYGVTNLEVNLTSLVYMITYIPFIIHASLMLERVGLRQAVCLGAAGTAIGSVVKLQFGNAPTQAAFWGMMAGQTIVALSQLYIISIPPLLAAVWFPDHQVSTATGIGVFGNQLGIALGFIVPPLLVSNSGSSPDKLGSELNSLSFGVAILSGLIFVVAIICLKDKPPKPPGSASLHAEHQIIEQHEANGSNQQEKIDTYKSIKKLCVDRDFQLLTLSYGINVGCFYAISTVLNQMVAKNWPNPDDLAGTMGLLIVVSGMVGSVMCGQLLDRTHAFKIIILLIYFLSLVSMMLFTLVLKLMTGPWPLYLAVTTLGFFMTGYLPLGFEFAAETTYPHPANTPAGLLNLSAQVFGLALTYSSSLIVDKEGGDLWANLFLTACLTVGLILTAIMKADLKRQKAVAEEQTKC